ncbi:MAG: hypothetical protein MI746_14695 [Pseudomonadales bacterium]|nr:hypothetical protein [Pseudomonadales bacterium]
MITPSFINSRILHIWIPTYLIMVVHGISMMALEEIIEVFVLYPVLAGLPLALFNFVQKHEDEQLLERIGIPITQGTIVAIISVILLPLSFVLAGMVYAQLDRSYEDVSWIAIVFGMLIVNEVGKKIKNSLYQKGSE